MSTAKTTIYLNADDYRRLKAIAESQGRPAAELVREAVAEYVIAHRVSRRPDSIGAGRSGSRDLAERTEDLLAGFGEE